MPQRFLKKEMTSARERILLAAWDLFHERGMDGTSVDHILQRSETGKSQFYHYFGSKEGLVHAMLEEARRMIKDGDVEGMGPIEDWEDLRGWFDGFLEKIKCFDFCRACPIGRFAAELSPEDEAIRKDLLLVFEAKKQHPKEFFLKAQARGELKEGASPDELADFCQAIVQGAGILSKIYREEGPVKHTFDHAFAYLESFKIQSNKK